MNGYKLVADSYRKILEEREFSEDAKKNIETIIKVNDILASLTKNEIKEMYNSGAFNEITEGYTEKAMENLGFERDQIWAVIQEIHYLHDMHGAEEIKEDEETDKE